MPCPFCSYEHDNEGDRFGCPNCEGEGLDDQELYCKDSHHLEKERYLPMRNLKFPTAKNFVLALFFPVLSGFFYLSLSWAEVQMTAVAQGYFYVNQDGEEFSRHTTEREASEKATNLAKACPTCDTYYVHSYTVHVVWDPDTAVEPPPVDPVEPPPVDPVEPPPVDPPIGPVELPPVTVLYSRTLAEDGTLLYPQALTSEHLERGVIYVGLHADYWQTAAFYCCKSRKVDGTLVAPHQPAFYDDMQPLVHAVDLNTLPAADGDYELYVDAWGAGGQANATVFFTVEIPPLPPEESAVTVGWEIPTLRENNDPLPVEQLCCYQVYYEIDSGDIIRIDVSGGSTNSLDIDNLPAGTMTVFVTATDTGGLVSSPSLPVSVQLDGLSKVSLSMVW